jgi:hypothetical protein
VMGIPSWINSGANQNTRHCTVLINAHLIDSFVISVPLIENAR